MNVQHQLKGLLKGIAPIIPRLTRDLDLKRSFQLVEPGLMQVENRLRAQVAAFDPGLVGYVEYVCSLHGKRIRPALTLLSAEACGKVTDAHLDLGLVVELIHLATLVHDDILDGADQRRGQSTVCSKWGAETAVLLGDCLFSHALVLCTRLPGENTNRLIAEASHEVCTGEILQTQRRFDLTLSIEEYFKIIGMKTGALFRVSSELAGSLSGAPHAAVDALRTYGQNLGVAYQIYDDCLDLVGKESETGKTLGTDLAKGKLTLPLLHVLQQLKGSERQAMADVIVHGSAEDRLELIGVILDRGGLTYAVRQTQELLKQGTEQLNVLPDSTCRRALQAIPLALSEHIAGWNR